MINRKKNKLKNKITFLSLIFFLILLIFPSFASAHNESTIHKNIGKLNDSLLLKNLDKIHEDCIYMIKGEKYILVKDHIMSNPNLLILKNKLKGGLK